MEMQEQIVVWEGQGCITVLFAVDVVAIWELHAPWHLLQPKKVLKNTVTTEPWQKVLYSNYILSEWTQNWTHWFIKTFYKSFVFPWDAQICWMPIEFQIEEKPSNQSPPLNYVPPNWSLHRFQTCFENRNPFPIGGGLREAYLFFRCLTTNCP